MQPDLFTSNKKNIDLIRFHIGFDNFQKPLCFVTCPFTSYEGLRKALLIRNWNHQHAG
jgi:hypothetical protein